MSKNTYHSVPLAIGEFVVLETNALTPDKLGEEITSSGIIIKTDKPDFSKAIPRYAEVVSKGELVPDSALSIGDIVVFPNGQGSSIEDPRIIEGQDIKTDERRQFSYCHWKNIGAKFIKLK